MGVRRSGVVPTRWPVDSHISIREMIPVVVASALWGASWSGKSVRFWSDNTAAVALINSGSSRDNSLMHLMRCLVFIMAKFNFVVSASHIKGVQNVLADALSRDNHTYFITHYPQAQPTPTAIPPELVQLLITTQPDWISPHWTSLWTSIFGQR